VGGFLSAKWPGLSKSMLPTANINLCAANITQLSGKSLLKFVCGFYLSMCFKPGVFKTLEKKAIRIAQGGVF